jgi:hypothetical protein
MKYDQGDEIDGRQELTLHIHALFLPEGDAQVLDPRSKASLDIFSSQGLVSYSLITRGKRMCRERTYALNQRLTVPEVLSEKGKVSFPETTRRQRWWGRLTIRCTLVISVVTVSISLSSALRSEKPGKTCFAWSFSKEVTVGHMRWFPSKQWSNNVRHTFCLGADDDILYLV